jgi:hypothetical protein
MTHSREEVQAAVDRYLQVRRDIDEGRGGWGDLAQFFTDDAVFIDPAWGRVEGIEEMRKSVFGDAMIGLDSWKFPVEFTMIDGDTVVVKWWQVIRGEDGTEHRQSGYSTLLYAGDGKFSYEEDLLNMVHVMEDIKAAGFRWTSDMPLPPRNPVRDFSKPARSDA